MRILTACLRVFIVWVSAVSSLAAPPARSAPAQPASIQATTVREVNGSPILGLAVSPNGKIAAITAAGSRSVQLLDLTTHQVIKSVPGGMSTQLVAFSPDGANLATSSVDFWINVNKIEDGSKVSSAVLSPGGVYDLAWMRDGKSLAVAQSNMAALIDPQTGATRAAITHAIGNSSFSLALAPDENSMAIGGSDGSVVIYSTREFDAPPPLSYDKTPRLKTQMKLGPHKGAVKALTYSPDGNTLVAGDSSGGVTLWDLTTREKAASWVAGDSPVVEAAFAPDGRSVAVATRGAENGVAVQLWTLAKIMITTEWKGVAVTAMQWMPDGKTLLVGDNSGGIHLVPVTAFQSPN